MKYSLIKKCYEKAKFEWVAAARMIKSSDVFLQRQILLRFVILKLFYIPCYFIYHVLHYYLNHGIKRLLWYCF